MGLTACPGDGVKVIRLETRPQPPRPAPTDDDGAEEAPAPEPFPTAVVALQDGPACWASAGSVAIAEHLAGLDLDGMSVVELGAGSSGLCALVAAARGARVSALADCSERARALVDTSIRCKNDWRKQCNADVRCLPFAWGNAVVAWETRCAVGGAHCDIVTLGGGLSTPEDVEGALLSLRILSRRARDSNLATAPPLPETVVYLGVGTSDQRMLELLNAAHTSGQYTRKLLSNTKNQAALFELRWTAEPYDRTVVAWDFSGAPRPPSPPPSEQGGEDPEAGAD